MESLSSRMNVRVARWPLASLLAAVCAAFGASQTQAQLYKWTDANGKTHYSDTVPPDAVDRARKEMRTDGVVKNSMERAMTPEEKRLAGLKAVEDERTRIAQSERERKDKALLATYTDLKDFDRVRDRNLSALDAEIKGLSANPAVLAAATTSPSAEASASGAKPPSGKPAASTAPAGAKPTTAPVTAPAGAKVGVAPGPSAAEATRLAEAVAKKTRERAEMAALYEAERGRLAMLLTNERSRITTVVVPAPRR